MDELWKPSPDVVKAIARGDRALARYRRKLASDTGREPTETEILDEMARIEGQTNAACRAARRDVREYLQDEPVPVEA